MSFHLYDIREIFSSADGSQQFIELSVGSNNNEDQWGGQVFQVRAGSASGTVVSSFTVPADLPSSMTSNTSVLLATQAFENATGLEADFIIPEDFLPTDGGTYFIVFVGADTVSYSTANLPSDGSHSLTRSGSAMSTVATAQPKNFAGDSVTLGSANNPPTGSVVITGTATEDQTLTADASAVQDADGLGTFGYQWLRNGSSIGGANASTYTLGDADVGRTISVRVSYTDGQSNAESVTSSSTGSVANVNDVPTGNVTITGSATEGSTLTANTGGIADADGLGSFSYQWLRGGTTIDAATAGSYLLTQADVGFAVSVRASYTDGHGTAEQLTSAATSAVADANNPPTGSVVVTGTATEDQTLTANASGIDDADGLGTFGYQWLRNGSNIGGANASTYTLGDADVGSTISVRVSYTDGQSNAESVTSSSTGTVTNVNDAPTGNVTVTGSATQGSTLTANTGGIADADGLGSFSYQWLRGGTTIGGATAGSYLLTQADVGFAVSVRASYTDGHGTAEQLTSAATSAVADTNHEPTGTVQIDGTAALGETLTADTSGIGDADGLGSFSYQWLRDGGTIGGATSATYLLVQADVDAQISVRVSYEDGDGAEESLTSGATSPVADGIETIDGTAGDDDLAGTAGPDIVNGLAGNDTLAGAGGDDELNGGDGIDTAVLGVSVAGVLQASIGASQLEVETDNGHIVMTGIERVQLTDLLVAFDTDVGESVWNAQALLWAAFSVAPGQALLSEWVAHSDELGGSLPALAQMLLDERAPGVSSETLVTYLFVTLLHVAPTEEQVDQFAGMIGAGQAFEDNAAFLAFVAAHEVNTSRFGDFAGSMQVLDASFF